MSARAAHPTEPRVLRGVELRSLLLVRYGFRCCWCGVPLAATARDCCVEHLVPLGRGGPDRLLENLAPAHAACNEARGCLPVSDFVMLSQIRGRRPRRRMLVESLHELARVAPTAAVRSYAEREIEAMQRDQVAGGGGLTLAGAPGWRPAASVDVHGATNPVAAARVA